MRWRSSIGDQEKSEKPFASSHHFVHIVNLEKRGSVDEVHCEPRGLPGNHGRLGSVVLERVDAQDLRHDEQPG